MDNQTNHEPVAGQILYSVPQAARVLGISPRMLWRFIARGELRARSIGARRLVHRRDLEKFAARNHDTNSSDPSLAEAGARCPDKAV